MDDVEDRAARDADSRHLKRQREREQQELQHLLSCSFDADSRAVIVMLLNGWLLRGAGEHRPAIVKRIAQLKRYRGHQADYRESRF